MSKTYIVSRNGGTVTKAPINDNKIPIYANETALDADLANIPDNTLVATRGGHDDVIDEMKEYISEKISDSQSYFTEEKLTGGTWIDGKPIYRKGFRATLPTTQFDLTDLHVEKLLSCRGYAIGNNNNMTAFPYTDNSSYMCTVYYSVETKTLNTILTGYTGTYEFAIEYTKTTD